MKTQTLREKIEKIIDNQFIPIDIGVYDRSIDTILSLIQQEIKSAIPKKGLFACATQQELQENPYIGSGRLEGYNKALSDIQTKLKEKGLI